jgi:hypothetical protein
LNIARHWRSCLFMNRIILTVCFAAISCSPPDTSDRAFDDMFRAYVTAFNNNEYEKFLEYIPPQTFEKFSKEQVIESYKETQEEIGQTTIEDYEFLRRGPILTKGDSTFRKVRYKSAVVVFKEKGTMSPSAITYLTDFYGEENVEFDSVHDRYVIHQVKDLIFMRQGNASWTFLEHDSTKVTALTKRLVPRDILERL